MNAINQINALVKQAQILGDDSFLKRRVSPFEYPQRSGRMSPFEYPERGRSFVDPPQRISFVDGSMASTTDSADKPRNRKATGSSANNAAGGIYRGIVDEPRSVKEIKRLTEVWGDPSVKTNKSGIINYSFPKPDWIYGKQKDLWDKYHSLNYKKPEESWWSWLWPFK